MGFIANIPEVTDKKRVVVIGGGFAGLELVKKLNSKLYQIVLIDKNNYYQFQPLLYQVATAGLGLAQYLTHTEKCFRRKLYTCVCVRLYK